MENTIACYSIDVKDKKYETLDSIYLSWKKNWFELFETIDNKEHCMSDEFSRQDQFLALYLNNRIAGSIGFREVNLKTEIGRDDSYIKPWPKSLIYEFNKESILLMSGFNLNTEFRGRFMKIPSMFIFGYFIMQQFILSPNKYLATIARNDAGVNKFCSAFGAQKVGYLDNFHGKACDLMLFEKSKVNLFPLSQMSSILQDKSILKMEHEENNYKKGA